MRAPSPDNATLLTSLPCPTRVCSSTPVAASQSRTVQSTKLDTMRVPSPENATLVAKLPRPARVCSRNAYRLVCVVAKQAHRASGRG